MRAPQTARPDWALGSYLTAINSHRRVVGLVVLATVLGSIAFLQVRSSDYTATADLLVEPLPQDDETFLGLPLIRDTGDPTRTVQTAASLVESAAPESRQDATVEVNPKGESNILSVEATAGDADTAARVANDYAQGAIDERNEQLSELAQPLIRQLEARIGATPEADQVTLAALTSRLDQIRLVAESGDPTVVLSKEATPPDAPEGAPTALVVLLALFAGLGLGAGVAVLLELMDRRVRNEEELMDFLPVPVLARVPLISRRALRGPPGSVWYMPPEIREPYRTLVVQLEQSRRSLGAILVTSATKGDGKTTSAVNLAVALGAAGKRVILLDLDLRNPRVAAELRIPNSRRLSELVDPPGDLGRMLTRPTDLRTLSVLALRFEAEDAMLTDALTLRMPEFIEQARGMADHVIIDTPPLGEVSDALTLVHRVDEVLAVMRPGNTNRGHLQVLTELLNRSGKLPFGCIILSDQDRAARRYAAYGYGPGGAPDLVLGAGTGAAEPPERILASAE